MDKKSEDAYNNILLLLAAIAIIVSIIAFVVE